MLRKFLVILIFSVLTAASYGQDQNFQFTHLNITHGLSSNQVNCIFKDSQGFIWFGTLSGLNRYDGYNFKTFKQDDLDTNSIMDNNISRLFEGPGGQIWIRTQSDLNLYDPVTEKVNRRPDRILQGMGLPTEGLVNILRNGQMFYFVFADAGIYSYEPDRKVRHLKSSRHNDKSTNPITSASLDSKNYIWLLRYNGIIEKLDADEDRTIVRTNVFQQQQIQLQFGYSFYMDAQDELWLYQRNTLAGLFQYTPATNQVRHYTRENGSLSLSSNAINSVSQDKTGKIWVMTDHGGLNIIDKERGVVTVLSRKENDPKSISDEALNAVYRDDKGIMWIGTNKKGVSFYDEDSNRFPHYHKTGNDGKSLPFDDVNTFAEDKKGNLWIGTNGGGLIYFDRQTGLFSQFRHSSSDPNSISNDVIVALCIDHEEKLWIGTYLGGMDCFDGKTFKHYRHHEDDPLSLADDRVFNIFEDSNLNLWIGMVNFGMDRFDREKNIFYHHRPNVPQTIHSPNVTSITEDSKGNLWIGTGWGIDVLDKNTGRFIHYVNDNSRLSYHNVNGILEDHSGNIWVATNRGLNVMPKGASTFQSFFMKDGLPDNTLLEILEDDQHFLWVSTKSGISKIRVNDEGQGKIGINCVNFNEYDGLQSREFSPYAAYKTRAGELIFGGPNGFNLFRPAQIRIDTQAAKVVLTNFTLFNKGLQVGEKYNKHIILDKSISFLPDIDLKHNENDFSIEFAALDFTGTLKARYAYMLEGFNKEWVVVNGNNRVATYTNIDPGEYSFLVKAANTDGTWNENPIRLHINVRYPLWRTPLAYFLYLAGFALLLYLARKAIIARENERYELAAERRETQRMHELDLMKIKFFTNVSHEFRTPLSLILVPVEKLIEQAQKPEQKIQFLHIQRNARRLLNMVNQLLDFRKMEVNELRLHPIEGDIISFLREVSYSFTDLADNKKIQFRFNSEVDSLTMNFDQDKIERILFNLLSNAFKFTSADGFVSVSLRLVGSQDESFLEIRVNDTGIGIEPDKQNQIFDRFFQVSLPGSMLNQGSGIGLAITREFVEMHHGTIRVESQPGTGSTFIVQLPVKRSEVPGPANAPESNPPRLQAARESHTGSGAKKPVVLIVEDNDDFLFYLKENLQEHFTILQASNGVEGWKKTLSGHPDLIVSDISMPEMNGIELCQKIKNDPRTMHISVILLTALEGEQQQLLALETGSNDYLTKPFNFEILRSKIRNLLKNQLAVKQTYQKQLEINPSEITIDLPEDDFIKKALAIIEANMSNADFAVENLRQELLLSRTSMYKKILSITGKTPIEFIRSIRLKRAAQLLEKSNHNITEVAYMVGFNNPKYFARYFKEEFGVLPSYFQTNSRKKSINNPGSSPTDDLVP